MNRSNQMASQIGVLTMKQRAASSISLGLSLILLLGPFAAVASARESKAPSIGTRIVRLPATGKRLPGARTPQDAAAATGQTQTLLPDGRWLITGGMGPDGPLATMEINDPRTRQKSSLRDSLRTARAWHTATMLPDGNVFIFGGVNAKGAIIEQAEIFNPKSEEIQTVSSGLTPRSHHTATLLTDGRLLVAGGESNKGELAVKIEFWNFRTRTAGDSSAGLLTPRQGHTATLLANGSVLLWGGVNQEGTRLTEGEVYDPGAQTFSISAFPAGQDNPNAPYVEASLPNDGAKDVSLDAQLAIRFSKLLRVETVSAETVTLTGPQGNVSIKVVPAEKGMLAFVTPTEKLLPGAAYALSLSRSLDYDGRQLGSTALTFTTIDADKAESATDSNNLPDAESWVPDANNLRGNWRSNRPRSSWEDLPPLNAEPGVTALAGQALTLSGQPLANVNIQIDGNSASTDQTGRFLLSSIVAGHRVMRIDGRPASRPRRVYGTFKIGVEIKVGETNVLPFTLWMPKLDMAHAVTIASPTTREVVITNPQIPGLELHLPPGTVIRDMDGQTVTQVSLTPVPTDRPPFPLPPGVHVPVFFTAQPGGAQVIPPRARVIYPNFTKDPPGARITFWNYDPTDKGWYIYGQGTVTPDGRQVVPDPGVVVYEFTGIMIGSTGGPPGKGPAPGGHSKDGDPVDAGTGLFVYEKTDLVLPDTMPIVLKRTYRPGDNVSRAFGMGTSNDFEIFLWTQTFGTYQQLDLVLADGGRVHYVRTSGCIAGNNPCTSYTDAVFESTNTPTAFYKSKITFAGAGWELKLNDGTVFSFGDVAPLQSIRDRYGNKITIARDNVNSLGSPNGNIVKLTSTNGRWIQFTYDSANRVTKAKDNAGRTVNYTYDAGGRLWQVTDPNGGITTYTYDSSNQMLTIKDPRGIVYLTNEYDTSGRVSKQTQADGSTFLFAYTVDGNGKIVQTDTTNPRGNIHRTTFNASGYKLSETFALGKPEQQTITYVLQANTNLVLSVTDPLGRQATCAYDAAGNVTDVTYLAGTPQSVLRHYTYEPTFNRIASATDPLNHTVVYGYGANGNLTSVTDPLNNQTFLTYNTAGQTTSVTDPLSHTTQFTHNAGDLVAIRDPLNRSITRSIDAAGRLVGVTDSLGRNGRLDYDAFNQPLVITDPIGGLTASTYDRNGNMLTLTDASGSVTGYTFNSMDRLTTRTDPLQHSSSYQYDLAGNLSRVTDRKGQATNYAYDSLGRLKQITYADASTAIYTYDAGNRLRQVVDSLSGTINRDYDDLDRLTQQTTPQGTINYTYDAAGRRTSMTVLGQPTVAYSYDLANRLTGITQGGATVALGYDAAGRRTSLTLPNGLLTEYGYDEASQLTAITYKMGVNVLGNLTYAYDAVGQLTTVGGSYARTALPAALSSATYNLAHQQVTRGTQTLSYDSNGNLTTDGANTYYWNARNQLVAISGSVSASFQYDAFGKRTGKTVNGQSTGYLYDGVNVVQEQVAGTPTANLMTGGVDHVFTRTDAAGTKSFLPGGAGSTVALANGGGAVETEYTYDPFGNTTTTGTASSNSTQYTGRESDGTGLYYYRSRYYSPTLQRFISEDPIGLSGGPNLYAYAGNNPTTRIDPFGTDWAWTILCYSAHIAAGFGDTISFGATKFIRSFTPARKTIDTSSGAYGGGQVGGVVFLVVAGGAGAGAEAAESELVSVVHFTDEAGMAAISESGTVGTAEINAFVTLPSEVSGATTTEVESLLEIAPGKGNFSITFDTPSSNLMTPFNGPTTSGGVTQFQLVNPAPINPSGFVPTP
jgi:RHS repeat-associated protein